MSLKPKSECTKREKAKLHVAHRAAGQPVGGGYEWALHKDGKGGWKELLWHTPMFHWCTNIISDPFFVL